MPRSTRRRIVATRWCGYREVYLKPGWHTLVAGLWSGWFCKPMLQLRMNLTAGDGQSMKQPQGYTLGMVCI